MTSQVTLLLDLDSKSKEFEPGELVKGTVRATVKKASKCHGLSFSFGWQTHGKGNCAKQELAKTLLFEGRWDADKQYEYPFEFEIPAVLPTYRGHAINLDYYFCATADLYGVPAPTLERNVMIRIIRAPQNDVRLPDHDYPIEVWWGDDNKRDLREFLALHRGELIREIPGNELATLLRHHSVLRGNQGIDASPLGAVGCFAVIAIAINLLIVSLLASAPFLVTMLAIVIPNTILAILLFFVIRNAVAQKKIGSPTLKFEPSMILHPGCELNVALELTPESDVAINSIDLTLQSTEVSVSGSGAKKKTQTHLVFSNQQRLSGKTKLRAKQPQKFQTRVFLPEHVPLSFYASDNTIQWSANIRIDIPLWPDWVVEIPLICFPTAVACALNGEEARSLARKTDEKAAVHSVSTAVAEGVLGLNASARQDDVVAELPEALKSLDLALAQLKECRFDSDRDRVFENFDGHIFQFDFIVESVKANDQSSNLPGFYEDGLTVKGQIVDYGVKALVQFEASLNDEVTTLQSHDELECHVQLKAWNDLNQLPIFLAKFE